MKERRSGQFTKSLAKGLRPGFEFSQLVWVTITVAKMILVVQRCRHGVRAHIHTEDERLAAAAKEDFVSFSLRKKEQRCQWCLSYCYIFIRVYQKCNLLSWLINSFILIFIFIYSYSLYVYKNLLSTNKCSNKNLWHRYAYIDTVIIHNVDFYWLLHVIYYFFFPLLDHWKKKTHGQKKSRQP